MSATGTESPLRGVLLDFIVRSLASIGKNGFAMVDAKVDTYVKFIAETVQKANQVVMTCVVRPYWFVVDEIRDVSLPPYKGFGEYGKGEHLRFFRNKSAHYQRWLIVDEHMLAEIFLSVYIDKYFVENVVKGCPVCKACTSDKSVSCPFHDNRIQDGSIDEVPEIWWFKREVNEKKNVELIYTLVRADDRKVHTELDDRVYVSNPQPPLDIRFNFTNLESGILRIRWGNKAQKLSRITISTSDVYVNPETGNQIGKQHRFFKSFQSVLTAPREAEQLKRKIKEYLELLENQLEKQGEKVDSKNSQFTSNIGRIAGEHIRKCLAEGDDNFRDFIVKAIKELISALETKNLLQIYSELIEFYKRGDIPKIAYVVTHDPLHPDYPLRVAMWEENWEKINAPD